MKHISNDAGDCTVCGVEICRAGNSPCTEGKAPLSKARAETGALQFGKDWPGIFLCGVDAFAIALRLEDVLTLIEEGSGVSQHRRAGVREIITLLRSCIVTGEKDIEAPPSVQRALLLE